MGSSASFVMDINLWGGQTQVPVSHLLCKELSDVYNDVPTIVTFSKINFPWTHERCFMLLSLVRGGNHLLFCIHYLQRAPWSIIRLSTHSSRMMNRNPQNASVLWLTHVRCWVAVSTPVLVFTIKEINRCMWVNTQVLHFCWGKAALICTTAERKQIKQLLIIWSNFVLQKVLKLCA